MQLTLEFENINEFNGTPTVAIRVNGTEYYNGKVVEFIDITLPQINQGYLEIEHHGKTFADTHVIDGQIVKDKNFTLKRIIIDNIDIEELKWNSKFVDVNKNTIPGCLFFGPNGVYTIEFESPVLKWMLSTRHLKNNNDPNWEEDYQYYTKAVGMLKELQ